ncbi:MAG: hypothetical protein JNL74_14035 [Fibrobacteres bacterium]|nr:hypothetical protein [Fibrobacterota bacterium]
MPDAWEIANGLNPNSNDANGIDLSTEGYTNIEMYINGIVDGTTTAIMSGSQRHASAATRISVKPNPFNPETQILCEIPTATIIRIDIFSSDGKKVSTLVNGFYRSGSHAFAWKAADRPSGIYYARVAAGTARWTVLLLLLK